MTEDAPFRAMWDGRVFRPVARHEAACAKRFTVGEVYSLAEREERSEKTHKHEFGWLRQAWKNIPEGLSELYPTPDHLRKRALIDAGFYDETAIDCGKASAAEAVKRALKKADDFALVFVRGAVVIQRTAKSQSRKAMDRDTFQRSKQAVLEIVSAMIGVKPEELTKPQHGRPCAPIGHVEAPALAGDAAGAGNLSETEDA